MHTESEPAKSDPLTRPMRLFYVDNFLHVLTKQEGAGGARRRTLTPPESPDRPDSPPSKSGNSALPIRAYLFLTITALSLGANAWQGKLGGGPHLADDADLGALGAGA